MSANEARTDVVMRPIPGQASSDAEDQLVQAVDRTLSGLRTLYLAPDTPDDRRAGYAAAFAARLTQIEKLAQVGLTGEKPQTALAKRSLDDVRQEILDREAPVRKQGHMRRLAAACVKGGALPLLVGLGAHLSGAAPSATGAAGAAPPVDSTMLIGNLGLLLAACAAGVWVSFGARKAQYTFDDLTMPERDYLSPGMRLAFAFVLTAVMALLFHAGAAKVTIGSVSTADVLTSPVIATLVGFLCGFSEQVLAKSVQAQASRILGS
ncbi:MAG: hypothetical protein HY275_10165 [Gemmatimonadetes bacterium]|nr:hypothetical protein [Gemmatimonadota bacterium]